MGESQQRVIRHQFSEYQEINIESARPPVDLSNPASSVFNLAAEM
jgi:hypothetical protein